MILLNFLTYPRLLNSCTQNTYDPCVSLLQAKCKKFVSEKCQLIFSVAKTAVEKTILKLFKKMKV